MLTELLIEYRAFRKCQVILVFDAYKVKGGVGSVERRGGIYVVYTKEAETADAYIEKTTYDLGKDHRVRVATSDGMEPVDHPGPRGPAPVRRAFRAEVEQTRGEIAALIARHNVRPREENKRSTRRRSRRVK